MLSRLAILSTAMVASSLAGIIQLRTGVIDTASTPSLRLTPEGQFLAASNAFPRTRLAPSGMTTLAVSPASTLLPLDSEDIYMVEVASDRLAGFSAHHAASVVGYLPENVLLLKLSASDALQVSKATAVSWMNLYPAEHKVSARVHALLGDEASIDSATADAIAVAPAFATASLSIDFDAAPDTSAAPAAADAASGYTLVDSNVLRVSKSKAPIDTPALTEADDAEDAPFDLSTKRRAEISAALNAAAAASTSVLGADGLPTHTLTVMLSAPLNLSSTLDGYSGALRSEHAAAAQAAAASLADAVVGVSSADAGAFAAQAMRTLAAPMRALGLASAAPLLAALRAPMATAATPEARAAAPQMGSLLLPLATTMNEVSHSVRAAPRNNAGNFESLSSVSFAVRSPLFSGGGATARPDVAALVAEAAFNVVGEAAAAGPRRYATLASASAAAVDADVAVVAAASAVEAQTALARHISAVTRALVAASASSHVAAAEASMAASAATEGFSVQATETAAARSFATAAAAPAYQRALSSAVASVLSLQTRMVARTLSASVSSLAAASDVMYVDVAPRYRPLNKRVRWVTTTFSDPVPVNATQYQNQLSPFHAAGITGSNNIVGVADTGVDGRSCYFRDTSASVPFGSTASSSHRKFVNYVVFADNTDSIAGHGSHVVGTITGSALNADTWSESGHNGVAPDAKVSFYDLEVTSSGAFYVPDNLDDIFAPAYSVGARIHSNSWGCSNSFDQTPAFLCNDYSSSDFYIDRFMKRQNDFLIIVAAGNDGAYAHQTVGSPATSKNIISVGAASQSLNSAKENMPSNAQIDQADYFSLTSMASFSSTGPTMDGRIKPDISAPGHALISARSGTTSTSGSTSCRTTQMSGTSMATPSVSGTAVLVRDYLRQGFYGGKGAASTSAAISNPSATLIKAVIINSGQDMARKQGNSGDTNAPMLRQTGTAKQGQMLLGALYSITSVFNDAEFFVTPSTTGTTTLRFLAERSCSSTKYSIDFSSMGGSNVTGATTLVQEFNVTGTSTFTLKFAASPSCPIYLGILEFEATNAPRARPVSCTTTFAGMPSFAYDATEDALVTAAYPVSCPSVTQCLASSAAVQGISMYTPSSSICRAAIHTGSVNTTYTGSQAVMPAPISYTGSGKYPVKGSTQNGVTSSSSSITSGTSLWMPQVGGYISEAYMNTVPIPNGPNTISGFGSLMLTAALPVADSSRSPTAYSYRQLVIISDGARNLTDSSFITGCFLVSSLQELTTGYSTPNITYTYGVGSSRIKVTLAYSDYAQTLSAAKAIVNDLDLHVFGPRGQEWRGNDQVDRLNSVEQVWLRSFNSGMYCATATGAKVPLGEQKYALVASGPGVEACAATAPSNVQLSGTYTVTAPTCNDTPISSLISSIFIAGTKWGVVQGGDCMTLRNAATTPSASFLGLRRSSLTSTAGNYAPIASLAASGRLSSGTAASLVDNEGNVYTVTVSSSSASSGAVLSVNVAESATATYSCTATLSSTITEANVQGEELLVARYDIDEPPMNAAPAHVAPVWVAFVILVASLALAL